MAAYVCPQVSSPSGSLRLAKGAINAMAVRGNDRAKKNYLEVERLELLLSQQTQMSFPGGQGHSNVYSSGTALTNHAADDPRASGFDTLFFSDFPLGDGFAGSQMLDLAEALSVGDFEMFLEC